MKRKKIGFKKVIWKKKIISIPLLVIFGGFDMDTVYTSKIFNLNIVVWFVGGNTEFMMGELRFEKTYEAQRPMIGCYSWKLRCGECHIVMLWGGINSLVQG
jgi:hypothetical protein